jgi:hypothetical protein
VSESFLTAADVAEVTALRLQGFATRLAIRGRSVAFKHHDESTGLTVERAAQTVLVTFDAQRATEADAETLAAAWSEGTIEREGTLVVAPGDWFSLDGYPAHVTAVLPPDRGVERARFALGAAVGGAG